MGKMKNLLIELENMSTLDLPLNKYLHYQLYFANFGGTWGDNEVAIMEVVDTSTLETIATVMKDVLEPVSADQQQRDTQLRNEFDGLVNLLSDNDWQNISMFDDDEWVLTHRVMYALTHAKYEDTTPF